MNKEKLKVLIDSIKTANDMMRKQIEINGRAVELLGEFITEPETLGKAPHSDNVPSLSGFNIIGQEIDLGNEWVKDETIKPEDMKAGEWYVLESWYNWILKFKRVSGNRIITFKHASLDGENSILCILKRGYLTELQRIKSIRKATQQEVLKYFPNELEVPTHGGNDAGHIASLTDNQLKENLKL